MELFIPPESGDLKDRLATLLADGPGARHGDNHILTRSGERRLIRWNNSVLRSGTGEVIGTASIGEDVTEQKRSEVKDQAPEPRLHPVPRRGINTALIVRVAIRRAVQRRPAVSRSSTADSKMAWMSVVARDRTKVIPIAAAGAKRTSWPPSGTVFT